MADQAKIAVCVSTYNGEKYISEQLDSVLSQNSVEVDIYIRDDGSSDNTVEVLKKYESLYSNVRLFMGENIGFVLSFIDCIKMAGPDYEYYAFCDQDDVWYKDKLSSSLGLIQSVDPDKPALVFSEVDFCDEELNVVNKSQLKRAEIQPSLFLFDNMCSGNTMLFNNCLRQMILMHDVSRIYYHDWWAALICAYFGNIIYNEKATVAYRRTPTSVSLNSAQVVSEFICKVKAYLVGTKLHDIKAQLVSFVDEFGSELNGSDKSVFVFVGKSRLKKAFSNLRLRQGLIDELLLRLLFVFGRL